MPGLLSGKSLRRGGSGSYIDLKGAQPQLPPTPTTSTGYTLITNSVLVTGYSSSLGNIQFDHGSLYSNVPYQNINIIGTGTSTVIVSGGVANAGTDTGALVVQGGIGISDGIWTGKDIHVNGLTIGQGWQGLNNIVIRGVATPQVDDALTGQESIVIGHDALQGLSTSYKSIAIGRNTLSSGTGIQSSIAIGDSALKNIGVHHSFPAANITAATKSTPILLTAPAHGLTSGTMVTISGIVGMIQLNSQICYTKPLTANTLALYRDVNMLLPLNGNSYSTYISGGLISVDVLWNHNIAIGIDAGNQLIDGEQNLFLGDRVAQSLTTGSYNILLGHEVGNNMTRGNANISIGGDNLIDGLDNQVNIGSLLYYNGDGYTQINSDIGFGLGSNAVPTSFLTSIIAATNTNPVVITNSGTNDVSSGTQIVISDVVGMTDLNTQIYYGSYINTTSFSIYYDEDLSLPVDGTAFGTYISGGTVNLLEPYGTMSVWGGVGIAGNLIVTDEVDLYSGMRVRGIITGTVTTAVNLAGGTAGSIAYQTTGSTTNFIPLGSSSTLLYSDGIVPSWIDINDLKNDSKNTENVFINTTVPGNTYYLALSENIGDNSPLNSETGLSYITTNTTTSSYFSSGTHILTVPGSIYSIDGNASQGNLLYTPTVTVGLVPHDNPRPSDSWVDPDSSAFYQWIIEDDNGYWLQIAII
jgi:hypothetical protein